MAVETSDEQLTEIPSDYEAFTKFRDTGELPEATEVEDAPAVGGEDTPPSESDLEEGSGQTAEASEAEEEEEQLEDPLEDDETPDDAEPVAKGKQKGLAKRMRELTGEIKALKAQLGKPADVAAAGATEVVSVPEPVAEAETPAPRLSDFEDTDESSAWDQYEAATRAYNKGETVKAIAAALKAQKATLETEHAAETKQAAWNQAASRYPDFNEVVSDKCQISQAMERVMRMDPEKGTSLAYYLGQHPEESLRIAKATLANNQEEWMSALEAASMELGLLRAKLPAPGKVVPITKGKAATAPPTPTKTITSASRPPTQIRGGVSPRVDPNSDVEARNYEKWKSAREREIAKQGR